MSCTMLRKFENEDKKQNKKNLRMKTYGKKKRQAETGTKCSYKKRHVITHGFQFAAFI